MAEFATPIYQSSLSKVYLVDSCKYHSILPHDSPKRVAMKVLNNESPEPDEINRFYKEQEILQDISHPKIRRVLARTKIRNKHILFMEWVNGVTIKKYGKRNPKEFLHLARQIVEALAELHAHRIIHKDISAHNIMVNQRSREIKIIDFGLSSRVEVKAHNLGKADRFEGHVHFISPEQAGLTNHVVDYRSDLYSVGCVFYYMLAGELPFVSDDKITLLNMHINRYPAPLVAVDPTIPGPLSNLVEKLIKKNPEDRYQSARGLLYDLDLMLSQLKTVGGISSDLMLAQRDCSGRLKVSRKLYGRDHQIATLLSAFDRVKEGTSETLLIEGFSGTGKTSLVNELHMSIIKKEGYFISGKYDRLQKCEPYSAILQALNILCDLILAESDEKFDYFQMQIQEAVAKEGKILTDVIPNLQLIIGDQPDVPEVSGFETKSRFNHVFREFLKAIGSAHRPILFFIDDLQWADLASFDLLSVLMTDKEIKHLLLVGAYRENEVSESHPLLIALDNMKNNNATIEKVEIGNLNRENINDLISDTLNSSQEETYTLTDLILEKTHGNAFFVIQFLKSLSEENLLYFCYDDFKWKWITEEIMWKNITDNVAELIIRKILKLSKKTQNALKMASCLGSQFELSSLRSILVEVEDVEDLLEEAILENIVIPSTTKDKKFRFSHDRIQQAAYLLIPESERDAHHLHIGRMLQRKFLKKRKLDENLFVVVNQLNTGLDRITDDCERRDVAELNLRASKKAKLSSAFKPAANFSSTGITLLNSNHWKAEYELSLKLYVSTAEMDYCNGDVDHMNEMLDQVFSNATSVLDKVEAFSIQIRSFRAQKKFEEALDTGLKVLDQLGETFPANPNDLLILLDSFKTKWTLWGKNDDVITSMAMMENERTIAAVRILAEILPSSLSTRPKLVPLVVFRVIQLTMKYGVSKCSAVGLGFYGVMNTFIGNVKEGYRFGQLALRILDRFDEKQYYCQIYCTVHSGINHWVESIRLSLQPLQNASQKGLEVGEIEFGLASASRYCVHLFFSGTPLVKVEEEMKTYCRKIESYKQAHILVLLAPFWQTVLNFMGCGSENPAILTGVAFDEKTIPEIYLEDGMICASIYFNRMIIAYYFHDYLVAAKRAEEYGTLKELTQGIHEQPHFVFYHGLISLELARKTPNNSKWVKIANESIAKMKKIALNGPDNFLNKSHLLEAEMAFLKGCRQQAVNHFDKAIELAESQKFMHEEALACERAGIFYVETGEEYFAPRFLSRACQVYKEWGAKAKVSQLKSLYGDYTNEYD